MKSLIRNPWPLALLLLACGKVSDPTPKGTVLFDWDRSTAKGYDPNDQAGGPKHPLVDAKILEGPKTRSYTVTVDGLEGKSFSFDLDVEAAKVSYSEGGKDTTPWATTKISAKVHDNDAFHLTGKCDDHVAMTFAAPGEAPNTVVDCYVTGKRPNSMGAKDAITVGTSLQLEGTGAVMPVNDKAVKIVEH